MGSTCKYLGFSSNTTDQGDLQKVQDAIVGVKPHLKALNTQHRPGLVKGSTAIAMDWDYDVALLQQQNDKIKWVLPDEGVHAYLEGFFAVKNTSKIAVIQAFMNFLLDPPQYADFVNTTGTAYMMPAATPLVKKTISQNPMLVSTTAVLAKTEFDKYLGAAEATLGRTSGIRSRRHSGPAGDTPPRCATRPWAGRLAHYALLVATLVIALVCFVIPLGLMGVYSFGSISLVNFDVYFGWTTQNYRAVHLGALRPHADAGVFLSLSTTLACASSASSSPTTSAASRRAAQQLLLVAVIVPFWTSFIVRTYAWVDLLQNCGPLDRFARRWACTVTSTSVHAQLDRDRHPLLLPAADDPADLRLAGTDRPGLYDAAADLGATPWRQFRRVVLPHARARPDRRHHHRRRPRARRVRDPRDPRAAARR